jgi:DNA-binding MarR family transcriptional regulator
MMLMIFSQFDFSARTAYMSLSNRPNQLFAQCCCVLRWFNVTKLEKYVNMADINLAGKIDDNETVALIELLFFAYRDFVSDPDAVLDQLSFGRAHHRVVHFVGRDPGMTVAQLLDILRITKQSLSRVLKDLIDQGYIYQLEGETDRRQRLLHLTPAGEDLRQRLMAPQMSRIRRAIAEASPHESGRMREIFYHLISPENREDVAAWIDKPGEKSGG